MNQSYNTEISFEIHIESLPYKYNVYMSKIILKKNCSWMENL